MSDTTAAPFTWTQRKNKNFYIYMNDFRGCTSTDSTGPESF